MKKIMLALTAAAFLVPAAATAGAKSSTGPKNVTLKGEVLDSTCYFTKGAKGASHKECAVACLKKGATPSFLSGGTLYLLIAEHGDEQVLEDAKAKAGDEITVSGKLYEKDGVKTLALTTVK